MDLCSYSMQLAVWVAHITLKFKPHGSAFEAFKDHHNYTKFRVTGLEYGMEGWNRK